MLKIIQVDTDTHICHVRELFWENFSSASLIINREFGIYYDIHAFLEQEMAKLQQFAPPEGRLLLAEFDAKIVGCAGLRKIGEGVGEIKRMYVKPEFRRKKIGQSLLENIINQACQIGYAKIRLDTAFFAKEAQQLYRKFGFQDIAPYPGSEIPENIHSNWVFMELILIDKG